jgi:serine phosphatase RsbU (regulator of sigma subunit)
MRYAGAGHPPLLIQPGDEDNCVALESNGLMMGQFPDADYDSLARPLKAHDRLILYTDGFLESENPRGEEFGSASLQTFIKEHRSLAAEDFADKLLAAVSAWAGVSQGDSLADDLSLVVVDVRSAATRTRDAS